MRLACILHTAYLGILFFGLELKLNVEQQDLGVLVALWLHLKASIGEGFLEGNTVNKETVSQTTTLNFLRANHPQVQC